MNSIQTIINPIDLIDKDFFQLLGIENAPEETKRKIMDNALHSIQNRILARILDNLTEEESQQFDKLLEGAEEDKMGQFLTSKGIDLQKISTEETLYYKTEIMNTLAKSKQDSKQTGSED